MRPAVHPDLDVWHRIAKRAEWRCLADVRQTFHAADVARGYTVFNIKGNHFRLACEINYRTGRFYIRKWADACRIRQRSVETMSTVVSDLIYERLRFGSLRR